MKQNYPDLLKEYIEKLFTNIQDKIVLDCTYGRGGHSISCLENGAKHVYMIDYDNHNFLKYPTPSKFLDKYTFIHDNFINIKKISEKYKTKFDIIIIDLGIHIEQILDKKYGTSYTNNNDLNMIIDTTKEYMHTGKYIINNYDHKTLSNIFYYLGGERKSKQIANQIIKYRYNKKIDNSYELSKIITKNKSGYHTQSRIFQSIRIFINQEIQNLVLLLHDLSDVLNYDGEILFLTFHSLEDLIIKNYLLKRKLNNKCEELFNFLKLNKYSQYINNNIIMKKKDISYNYQHNRRKTLFFMLRIGKKLKNENIKYR